MIPAGRPDVLDAALEILAKYGRNTSIRGRFVAMYLGLRLMGPSLPKLGSNNYTTAIDLQQFLDDMWTKTHQQPPLVVLTAPFGGSTSPTAPYSTRTGERAPDNTYATNTWRNNFNIQKGVGCPADADVIERLLKSPTVRLSCPHMQVDPEGRYLCGIAGTSYRGEEHSIWLRMSTEGYQAVDLDLPATYSKYLPAAPKRIPIFPLIGALYSMAPQGVYPARTRVGIPDFAADFHFALSQVEMLFDCDPDSVDNMAILGVAESAPPLNGPEPFAVFQDSPVGEGSAIVRERPIREEMAPGALPELAFAGELNTGVGAELAVASDLKRQQWDVGYRGNQRGLGYDLEATRQDEKLHVEVKSSIGFTVPELTEGEWAAAQRYGDRYVLAVVDFYGSDQQAIWYVRDPANSAVPVEVITRSFRFQRIDVLGLGTEAEFL